MTHRIAMLLGAFLLFPSTGAMAQDTDEIMDFIDGRYESTADMARTLWEYAEVDSWTTIDALYAYTFTGLIGDSDTTLSVGVNNIADEDPPRLARNNDDGTPVTRFDSDGLYVRGWVDRPGYDDRAGHDIRGRTVYMRFKHAF